jgi:hypothetical protein
VNVKRYTGREIRKSIHSLTEVVLASDYDALLNERTESDRCCVDIYNDLDEYEAKRNPRSIFLAWQRGRSIERPTKAVAPAEPVLWPCPNPSLDGAYIDGQEIGPQVFAIGRLTWDSANKRWQCLADVGGALCMVEVKVRAQPESRRESHGK